VEELQAKVDAFNTENINLKNTLQEIYSINADPGLGFRV
jgi:hypothetical protein